MMHLIEETTDYLKEKGFVIFEELKVNTILFIDGVKTVAGLIKSAFNIRFCKVV